MRCSTALSLAAVCVVVLLIAAGCKRPPEESGQQAVNVPSATATPAPSPTPAAKALPTPEDADWSLAAAVVQILSTAHHTGSLVEHCQCGPKSQIVPIYSLHPPVTVEPLDKAMQEIQKHYPDIQWSESGQGHVRVVDSSAAAGLLRVRVKEFLVIEDRPPQAALEALWKTAEVQAYMAKHNVRFARPSRLGAPRKKGSPTVIQMKNATVEDIMDRIVDGYRARNHPSMHKVWLYRECHSATQTLIEVRVL